MSLFGGPAIDELLGLDGESAYVSKHRYLDKNQQGTRSTPPLEMLSNDTAGIKMCGSLREDREEGGSFVVRVMPLGKTRGYLSRGGMPGTVIMMSCADLGGPV